MSTDKGSAEEGGQAKGAMGKAAVSRRALGKGLESLLAQRSPAGSMARAAGATVDRAPTEVDGAVLDRAKLDRATLDGTISAAAMIPSEDPGGKAREIPLDKIDTNPYQTRMRVDEEKLAELARSIEANGVVQPIIVRPLPTGRFQLIAGERRWRASEKAGKATVPAILRIVSDEQAMEMTIVENLQRADLNPIEQARAYERLSRDFKMTQEQMAQRTGKDRATVSNFLRLLRLPPSVQNQVEAGELSFGHARTLLALDSSMEILKAASRVTDLAMSVRQTETYIQGLLNPEKKSKGEATTKPAVDPNVREAQELLQRQLGLRVRIEDKNGKGRVVIEYSGLEDFDAIMTALGSPS